MNGPIAQLVALTSHANAFLQGRTFPRFFPGNSTCQFCDWVKFFSMTRTLFGKVREKEIAATPDAWFDHLKTEGVFGVHLTCTPQNDPGIPDRMSAAFVGGGGTWTMRAEQGNGRAAVWSASWQVWNQNAPERRIWRVAYRRGRAGKPSPPKTGNLQAHGKRLHAALTEIHAFSQGHDCGGFTGCFARALETLDSGGMVRHGYHRDLAPEACLPSLAAAILDACQTAWVFGGMGSWNDLGFEGADKVQYDRVSERLFTTLNEAIQVAANASLARSV